MNNSVWRPLVPTGREDVRVEGFPEYLREATFKWIRQAVDDSCYDVISPAVFIDFQNAMRNSFNFTSDKWLSWDHEALGWLRGIDDDLYVNFLDYLVQHEKGYAYIEIHPVEQVLSEGGSVWSVQLHDDRYRVVQRVPEGVRETVNKVLTASDKASRQLRKAWADAYGVNPRPSEAYSNAVVAVEIAALSCIKLEPKNGTEPTLSSLFSILEAERPKWKLILRDSPKVPGAKSLATMLRTLWRGHESRHGRPDYTDASNEEARAAVMLAATLVQWFTTGVVQPAEGTDHTEV
jgi:hypothetical protein